MKNKILLSVWLGCTFYLSFIVFSSAVLGQYREPCSSFYRPQPGTRTSCTWYDRAETNCWWFSMYCQNEWCKDDIGITRQAVGCVSRLNCPRSQTLCDGPQAMINPITPPEELPQPQ